MAANMTAPTTHLVPAENPKMSKLEITEAGAKSYRRPYDEDDMQDLRDAIYDAVRKWARQEILPNGWPVDDLSQLDVKRMALRALELSILDIQDVGETVEDIDGFAPEVVKVCKHLIRLMLPSSHEKLT